jgi:hypothetical protein
MSTNQPSSILTQEHLDKINSALSTIAFAKQEIALAKLAGLDTSKYEQQIATTEGQLRQLKSVYFPGK